MSVKEALVGRVVATKVLEELVSNVHDLTHPVVILCTCVCGVGQLSIDTHKQIHAKCTYTSDDLYQVDIELGKGRHRRHIRITNPLLSVPIFSYKLYITLWL